MHVDLSIAGNSFCLGWMHDDGTCPVLSHRHRGASESLCTKLFCHWLQIKFCHDTRSGMNELCILTVCRCVFNFRAVISRREWSLSHKVIILSAVSVVLKLSFIMSLSWVSPPERLSVDEMNGTKYGQAVSPYARFSNTYDITLFQAPYHEPCCCFCSIFVFLVLNYTCVTVFSITCIQIQDGPTTSAFRDTLVVKVVVIQSAPSSACVSKHPVVLDWLSVRQAMSFGNITS
jgi:hypothetical protein